jgi:hypothetical protein
VAFDLRFTDLIFRKWVSPGFCHGGVAEIRIESASARRRIDQAFCQEAGRSVRVRRTGCLASLARWLVLREIRPAALWPSDCISAVWQRFADSVRRTTTMPRMSPGTRAFLGLTQDSAGRLSRKQPTCATDWLPQIAEPDIVDLVARSGHRVGHLKESLTLLMALALLSSGCSTLWTGFQSANSPSASSKCSDACATFTCPSGFQCVVGPGCNPGCHMEMLR